MSTFTLMVCLALTSLAVQIQGQSVFYTNGTSGQRCGRGRHHCLSTARCTKPATCRCKRPLVGNGKIGCFRPNDAVVFLQFDPQIKTFNGEYLNIATPCRYKLIHYTLDDGNGTKATAEVYATNTLFQGGEYYVTDVLIMVSVKTRSKTGKHSVFLKGSTSGRKYTFVTNVLEDSLSSSTVPANFRKYSIALSTDNVNNFIVARMDGVGLTVRFRPRLSSVKDVQKMVPGVTVVVDREMVGNVTFVFGALSSSPHGPNLKVNADYYGMDMQSYVYLFTILNTPATVLDDSTCRDTSVAFETLCTHQDIRPTVLATCGSVYSDKEFLTCLYDKDKMDANKKAQKLIFRYCVQSVCSQNVDTCSAMMSQIELTQCQPPSTLKDFKCSNLVT